MKRSGIRNILAAAVCLAGMSRGVGAADPADQKLASGDYVAIVGDSITEQKIYSVYIEDYLLMCKPALNLESTQFGWSGETARGFANRMENDMLEFHANVATTCFGMNDGGYSPQNPDKAKGYHDAQTDIVQKMKAGGVRFIVVGSPGAVDTDTFRHDPSQAAMYNQTLGTERDIAKLVAQEQGVAFANVYDPMIEVMEKAKAKYGHDYAVAGGDGVHPGPNGHLVMAYAFLKGLGCDGNIGTITFDLAANRATATEGHQVLSASAGTVEVESSRYPFCFFGDPKSPDATAGVIEFLPFNQDLNRFMLIVNGADVSKQYKVTWGSESKTFSGRTLANGINLPAEFLQSPFAQAFERGEHAIRDKQNFETPLVKELIHNLPAYERLVPEERENLVKMRATLIARDKPLRQAAAKAVEPVRHTIKVELAQ